ncbi:TPA: ESPR domain-containing protein [Haemophilus influenzae]
MNKIFSVIWNVMTQTWAVVSELTRAHTKRASATVATAVLATLLSVMAQAVILRRGRGLTIRQVPNLIRINRVLMINLKTRMEKSLITSLVLLLWVRMGN